jgi:dTDP-4-dehydrorhamnose 3,5-epimerase
MSDIYAPVCERSIRWDDPDLAITWPFNRKELSFSDCDAAAATLDQSIGDVFSRPS